jgi:uroporphyrinogen decarboxylase
MSSQSKFIQTLNREQSAIPPIWFMRQAGRYLPEYRELRAKAGSFLDLCFNPDLASEVTLQPVRRFDLDAAILFADILLIPHALGQKLSFVEGEGPRLEPVMTPKDIEAFRKQDILERLSPVFETVQKTKAELGSDKALIGFAGSPWTVATYMLAGGPMKDPAALRMRYYLEGSFIPELIDLLADKTIDYLIAQIDAGADAIQLFDSWAGGLPLPVLDALSVKPMEKIAAAVNTARPGTPVIMFPKGVGEKAGEYAVLPHCDAIGIDYSMDPAWARANLSEHVVVQGGLDPLLVAAGGAPMEKAAETLLKLFHDVPYVFNLGHGFIPETPPEHVAALVDFVRRNG